MLGCCGCSTHVIKEDWDQGFIQLGKGKRKVTLVLKEHTMKTDGNMKV
jgi:hypothetical protein